MALGTEGRITRRSCSVVFRITRDHSRFRAGLRVRCVVVSFWARFENCRKPPDETSALGGKGLGRGMGGSARMRRAVKRG